VLAEDTGFSDYLPTGRGLLSFTDLEEALAGVAEIEQNYSQHMRAARELAEEYFNAEKTLPAMLSACG
jgi:CRISPR/Cas system CSM-associated protein Csm5 (group 7 of RAMP superfamily)